MMHRYSRRSPWQSRPPIVQDERIADLLDSLVVGRVAGDQFQAVLQGNGCDHRVSPSDGSADPFQFPLDPPRQLGRALVEREDLFRSDLGQEGLELSGRLLLLKAADDLHDGDDRYRVPTEGRPVRCTVAGHDLVHTLTEFGEDVGVEQALIHRGAVSKAAPRGFSSLPQRFRRASRHLRASSRATGRTWAGPSAAVCGPAGAAPGPGGQSPARRRSARRGPRHGRSAQGLRGAEFPWRHPPRWSPQREAAVRYRLAYRRRIWLGKTGVTPPLVLTDLPTSLAPSTVTRPLCAFTPGRLPRELGRDPEQPGQRRQRPAQLARGSPGGTGGKACYIISADGRFAIAQI